MNRDEAKRIIKDNLDTYLSYKGINSNKPFKCLNPTHNDHKPSMSVDRSSRSGLHCKCFSCGAYYDTLDLIAIDYGLNDEKDIFNKAYEIFNIQVDNKNDYKTTQQNKSYNAKKGDEEMETKKIDLTKPLEAAHEALLTNEKAINYLQRRGLSIDTIKRYKLGFSSNGHDEILKDYKDKQSNSPKAYLYKIIFPFIEDDSDKLSYFMSEIADRKQIDDFNSKYRKIKEVPAPLYNERYIRTSEDVVFITEGVYDALSVEEVGYKALAIAGTSHKRFIELCKKYKPSTVFVISFDNDNAGKQATERLTKELDELEIKYIVKTAANGKDFNEFLIQDRNVFADFIKDINQEALNIKKELEEQEKEAYNKSFSAGGYLKQFLDNMGNSENCKCLKTGLKSFDKLLDGGLYTGLYFVGAISSLGKTTFCLQVADNVAAAGNDVLFFSLEMSKKELMSRTMSRLSLLEDVKQNRTTINAKTTRDILIGSSCYNDKEMNVIAAAAKSYSKYANNIYIHEGIGDIGVKEVRNAVEKHIRITGNTPLVIIDYLQNLAPYNERYTDKQNIDKTVQELKRLSRDYDLVVLGISSFNRDNYNQSVNMTSFKESGAIEYSSDVLIGLQYADMDNIDRDKSKDKNNNTKSAKEVFEEAADRSAAGKDIDIQIKVLKSRNGVKGSKVVKMYPRFNYFSDDEIVIGDGFIGISEKQNKKDNKEHQMNITEMFNNK